MNCDVFRKQMADFFDRDDLDALPPELRWHAKECSGCRTYLDSLIRLNRGIEALAADLDIPDMAECRRKHFPVPPTHRTTFFGRRFGRGVAVAAVALVVLVAWFLSPRLSLKPISPAVSGRMLTLQNIRIDNRPATTVIYQPNEKRRPVILWLY